MLLKQRILVVKKFDNRFLPYSHNMVQLLCHMGATVNVTAAQHAHICKMQAYFSSVMIGDRLCCERDNF